MATRTHAAHFRTAKQKVGFSHQHLIVHMLGGSAMTNVTCNVRGQVVGDFHEPFLVGGRHSELARVRSTCRILDFVNRRQSGHRGRDGRIGKDALDCKPGQVVFFLAADTHDRELDLAVSIIENTAAEEGLDRYDPDIFFQNDLEDTLRLVGAMSRIDFPGVFRRWNLALDFGFRTAGEYVKKSTYFSDLATSSSDNVTIRLKYPVSRVDNTQKGEKHWGKYVFLAANEESAAKNKKTGFVGG